MNIKTDQEYHEAWNAVDDHMLNRTLKPHELDELMEAIFQYEERREVINARTKQEITYGEHLD